MFKGILFDLDGTLVDTAVDMIKALQTLASRHGIDKDFPVDQYRHYISQGSAALINSIYPELNQQCKQQLRTEYLNIYAEQIVHSNQLFPGVVEFLSLLDKNEIPWGIVTNKPSWLTSVLVGNIKPFNSAKLILSADQVGVSKPDPKPLLEALKSMPTTAEQTIYLGDAESDVIAARQAGMYAVVATWGYLSSQDRPENWSADRLVNSITELTPLFAISSFENP